MTLYADIAPPSHNIVQRGGSEIISKARGPDFVSFQEDSSMWFA